MSTYAKHHSTPSKETGRERESSARGDIMCVMYMCTCVKETAPLDIITFKNLCSVIKTLLQTMNVMYLGMKHREEHVVGGEVKPTSNVSRSRDNGR